MYSTSVARDLVYIKEQAYIEEGFRKIVDRITRRKKKEKTSFKKVGEKIAHALGDAKEKYTPTTTSNMYFPDTPKTKAQERRHELLKGRRIR